MKIINKIQRFMYGRYGIDDLYKFLFKLYLVLLIANLFINSKILLLIELVIIFIMFYRLFSKKIGKRVKENNKYLKIKKYILKPWQNIMRNVKDNNHVYKKCHHCKNTLRLPVPSKRGIKHVVCPICKKRNKFLVLKKLKIEVIKNNQKARV